MVGMLQTKIPQWQVEGFTPERIMKAILNTIVPYNSNFVLKFGFYGKTSSK
jgi:hypothetical protein